MFSLRYPNVEAIQENRAKTDQTVSDRDAQANQYL